MTIKRLIKQLQQLDSLEGIKKEVLIASDEEWTDISNEIRIQINGDQNKVILYGLYRGFINQNAFNN